MKLLLLLLIAVIISSCTMKQGLWATFLAGQALNAGNMNYQQEIGTSSSSILYGFKALPATGQGIAVKAY